MIILQHSATLRNALLGTEVRASRQRAHVAQISHERFLARCATTRANVQKAIKAGTTGKSASPVWAKFRTRQPICWNHLLRPFGNKADDTPVPGTGVSSQPYFDNNKLAGFPGEVSVIVCEAAPRSQRGAAMPLQDFDVLGRIDDTCVVLGICRNRLVAVRAFAGRDADARRHGLPAARAGAHLDLRLVCR